MRTAPGHQVPELADELAGIYAEVFTAEPWNEGPDDVAAFRRRLIGDADRPGFRAVVTPDGFATAWRTTLPLPEARAYPSVAAHLGPERMASLLDGALEVNELAVRPAARGAGLGRRLLAEVVGGERAWLLTLRRVTTAVAFYRRVGWREQPPEPGVQSPLALFTIGGPR